MTANQTQEVHSLCCLVRRNNIDKQNITEDQLVCHVSQMAQNSNTRDIFNSALDEPTPLPFITDFCGNQQYLYNMICWQLLWSYCDVKLSFSSLSLFSSWCQTHHCYLQRYWLAFAVHRSNFCRTWWKNKKLHAAGHGLHSHWYLGYSPKHPLPGLEVPLPWNNWPLGIDPDILLKVLTLQATCSVSVKGEVVPSWLYLLLLLYTVFVSFPGISSEIPMKNIPFAGPGQAHH